MEEYKKKYEEIIKSLKEAKESMGGYTFSSVVDKIIPELKECENTEKPNGGIVLEDFNEGEGFYKVNLAYLNKKQVIEIEALVKKWNPELKESEDEKIREHLLKHFSNKTKEEWNGMSIKDIIIWLKKQGEQKSKEKTKFYDSMDDLIADALIEEIENSELNDKSKHNRIFWIKSHRQNPTWSKEDERMLNLIIQDYEAASRSFCGHQEKLNWLKSLKERYTWKPSDEQINTLEQWLKDNQYKGDARYCYPIFDSLYQDLKKLRGE